VLIGLVLVWVAVRRRRTMGLPKAPKQPPKWHSRVDSMSPWYAAGIGALVQPWGLVAAGAATVVSARLSSFASYLALLIFCLLGSSTYIVIVLFMAFRQERSAAVLDRMQSWIKAHTDQAVVVGALALGLWLIGHSLYLILSD
jgi:fructose-specific phosphotransferase system IIC component